MSGKSVTLEDVCFAVAGALQAEGIVPVLTGGSAAALYAPLDYVSADADFIVDESLAIVERALAKIGVKRIGKTRQFSFPDSSFTVEFPPGPLAVGAEYVHETHVLERNDHHLTILRRADCVKDRLAHWLHWNDFTALNAAVSVTALGPEQVNLEELRAWVERELPGSGKFDEFERRLHLRLRKLGSS